MLSSNTNIFHRCDSADPVNFTDPTGEYEIHNKDSEDKVLVVFPDRKIEYKGSESINTDLKYYIDQGYPVLEVENMSDLAAGLMEAMDELNVTSVVFNSHGESGKFRIGSDVVNEKTDFSNLKNSFENCNVFIYSCNTGNGDTGLNLINKISNDAGCLVIAPCHKVAGGYSFDGGDALNWSAPSQKTFLRTFNNEFRTSSKSPLQTTIYNLSINRNGWIHWSNTNSFFLR